MCVCVCVWERERERERERETERQRQRQRERQRHTENCASFFCISMKLLNWMVGCYTHSTQRLLSDHSLSVRAHHKQPVSKNSENPFLSLASYHTIAFAEQRSLNHNLLLPLSFEMPGLLLRPIVSLQMMENSHRSLPFHLRTACVDRHSSEFNVVRSFSHVRPPQCRFLRHWSTPNAFYSTGGKDPKEN